MVNCTNIFHFNTEILFQIYLYRLNRFPSFWDHTDSYIYTLRPDDVYMRQWTRSSLVQVMARRQVIAWTNTYKKNNI